MVLPRRTRTLSLLNHLNSVFCKSSEDREARFCTEEESISEHRRPHYPPQGSPSNSLLPLSVLSVDRNAARSSVLVCRRLVRLTLARKWSNRHILKRATTVSGSVLKTEQFEGVAHQFGRPKLFFEFLRAAAAASITIIDQCYHSVRAHTFVPLYISSLEPFERTVDHLREDHQCLILPAVASSGFALDLQDARHPLVQAAVAPR